MSSQRPLAEIWLGVQVQHARRGYSGSRREWLSAAVQVCHSSDVLCPPVGAIMSEARAARASAPTIQISVPAMVTVLVAVAVLVGWLQRDEEIWTPKSGTGYWLGIIGALAMLLLLIYSLRKRFKSTRMIGTIPFWFRTHMLLGTLGPVLILFHANFRLGALNSNVAFFAMLTVAVSGVIGRYIYRRIHLGLYGRKAQVQDLLLEAEAMLQSLGQEMQAAAFVAQELGAFSRGIENKVPRTAFESLRTGATIALRSRRLRANVVAQARHLIREQGRQAGWTWSQRRVRRRRVEYLVGRYALAVRKAAELTFFERLFALWHVFHLPLFFLMLLSGAVHVWAVHNY